MAQIPDIVTRRFHSYSARPRVVAEYHPQRGWTESERRPRLDFATVERLHAEGVTLVRARWRLTIHEFSVIRLREEHRLPQSQ